MESSEHQDKESSVDERTVPVPDSAGNKNESSEKPSEEKDQKSEEKEVVAEQGEVGVPGGVQVSSEKKAEEGGRAGNEEETAKEKEDVVGEETEKEEQVTEEEKAKDENVEGEKAGEEEQVTEEEKAKDENVEGEKAGEEEQVTEEEKAKDENVEGEKAGEEEEQVTEEEKAKDENVEGEKAGEEEQVAMEAGKEEEKEEKEDEMTNVEKKPRKDESPMETSTEAHASHVYDKSWSKLSKDEIIDKIKGVIYGQAIGDAIGLATEFMCKKEAIGHYGEKGPSGYKDIVQDFHRSRWDKGDWTDDTDQMLLILQGIVKNHGEVNKLDFAERMHNWRIHGFKELGDYGGMGIGMTVGHTLSHRCFLTDPHTAAEEVWRHSGCYLAANGAIMRTSVLGILNFNNLDKVRENTLEICRCTHADPRCGASCVAVTTAIALMLQDEYDTSSKKGIEKLTVQCIQTGSKVLDKKDQKKELKEHVTSSLKKLKLDEKSKIGYTFKALGAGFYGLREGKDFRQTILEVIMEAGDADSNGAVCGAMMGCKLGFKALPEDLLRFPHRGWLDKQVETFLKTIGFSEIESSDSTHK